VVIKGQVGITQMVNQKVVTLGTLKERKVFGEMGLISETVRSANISAVGDLTVGVIDKEFFDTAMSKIPKNMKPIIVALVEHLRTTTNLLTRIGLEYENKMKILGQFYRVKNNRNNSNN
jgi:CRP/FNR family transcriptional regulator, cyclic AMP receptor protein